MFLDVDDDSVWILMPEHKVPKRWAGRARRMSLVPLVPDEAEALLQKGTAIPSLSLEDEQIARLAAQGLSAEEIAQHLHMAERSVYRKLARLRRLVGAASGPELAARLARHGF